MNTTYIIVGAIVLLAVYVIGSYNSFVVLVARLKEALSGIDVQLKRRADLIPNLVETVKGYAKHEKSVFENVTKARSALVKADSLADKAQADNMLTSALKSVFAVAEAYPQLQASENFKDLQRQLEDTEDKVAYSRQFYNSNALDLNTKVKTFPTNVIANIFSFKEVEFFQATAEERKSVKVNFA
ncbi:MAG: LemA family protein [Microgenomates group bacterium]|jgi:LemA protein|nr:LemA family protein [Candidatus Woesebacteria bacterium]QQR64383.1 MAG: LemA family protein [Candidatus Roizmanbacteria bacterium]